MKNVNSRPLTLELMGVDETSNPRFISKASIPLVGMVRNAMRHPEKGYGKALRESAQIKIWIGTTGRCIVFGNDKPADQQEAASAWMKVAQDALDHLRLINLFGQFAGRIEEILAIEDPEKASEEAMKVVEITRRYGGYPGHDTRMTRTVGKLFDIKKYVDQYNEWEQAAKTVEAAIKLQESKKVDTQAERLDAVVADGVPGIVLPETVRGLEVEQQIKNLLATVGGNTDRLVKALEAVQAEIQAKPGNR